MRRTKAESSHVTTRRVGSLSFYAAEARHTFRNTQQRSSHISLFVYGGLRQDGGSKNLRALRRSRGNAGSPRHPVLTLLLRPSLGGDGDGKQVYPKLWSAASVKMKNCLHISQIFLLHVLVPSYASFISMAYVKCRCAAFNGRPA